MIKFETIKKDFETIAKAIQQSDDKLKAENFVFRLVICYTDDDKAKYNNNYTFISEYCKELDKINIPYKSKDNKYFYLLNKTMFETTDDFETTKKQLQVKDKQLTINIKNLDDNKKYLLNYALDELKKEYSNK